MAGSFFNGGFFQGGFFGAAGSASNWQAHYWNGDKRTKKERDDEEKRQRIELGILPPELQAEAKAAANEAALASAEYAAGRVDAQNALGVAMQARETYEDVYRRAFQEAYVSEVVRELWLEDVKKAKRRRAAAMLLLH